MKLGQDIIKRNSILIKDNEKQEIDDNKNISWRENSNSSVKVTIKLTEKGMESSNKRKKKQKEGKKHSFRYANPNPLAQITHDSRSKRNNANQFA